MKAYGYPSIIVAMIIGKPETLIVTTPEENESLYTIKEIVTDFPYAKNHKLISNTAYFVYSSCCSRDLRSSNVLLRFTNHCQEKVF